MNWTETQVLWLIIGIVILIYACIILRRKRNIKKHNSLLKNRLKSDIELIESIRNEDWIKKDFMEVEIAGKTCFLNRLVLV